jgi:endo-1,4-beta-xylanase
MNRREFLRTGATATTILFASPAWCAEEEPSPPPDSEILSAAQASIERHRKGDATLRVEDASGKPVPGTKVTIEQLRHDFLFGCNLFLFARCGDPDQEEAYRQRFAALFNYCTLGFYWAAYEPVRGKPNYDYTDQVLDWTSKQAVICKGHPLVWDHPASSPRWLPDDPAEIAQLVHTRVKEIVARYRGHIDFWDVVNEATHLPDGANKTKMAAWGAALGPVPYVAEPLRIARLANPDATLLVNDYRTDPHYYGILSRLREEGKSLFDVVGIQSHMHQGVWPLHKVYGVCQQYAKLGAPIHFTETTILSGAREKEGDGWGPTTPAVESDQAEQVANFYTTLFAHPSVQALTWWDCSDYHAWQRAPAGLLRSDMSPKPAYARLLKLIKTQWWTKSVGSTDSQGSLAWRGFYGHYRIKAEASRGSASAIEVRLQRGQANQFTLRIRS